MLIVNGTKITMKTLYFLGIDISKKTFNAALTINGKDFHEVEVENEPIKIQSIHAGLAYSGSLRCGDTFV